MLFRTGNTHNGSVGICLPSVFSMARIQFLAMEEYYACLGGLLVYSRIFTELRIIVCRSSQWSTRRGAFMMLHADMTLLKQYKTSGEHSLPDCNSFDTCPENPKTAYLVSALFDGWHAQL